jgi:hypothetical protein
MTPQFRRKRYDYHNSFAYFRALCLITVLQRDLGVHYNPDKIPDDVPFDAADTFIHGALFGPGGTCATMPVVYAAVGRRLGYPIKLVTAKGRVFWHEFARWDEPGGERFNMEATNKGLSVHPDDYYRTGLYATTPEEEEEGGFLKSKTPRQELSSFLTARGFRWLDCGKRRQALEAFLAACDLRPEHTPLRRLISRELVAWDKELRARLPAVFPTLDVPVASRRYRGVPESLEQAFSVLETVEHYLPAIRYAALHEPEVRRVRTAVVN